MNNISRIIPADQIRVISGQRKNSHLYIINEKYLFYRDYDVAGTLRCSRKETASCPAYITISSNNTHKLLKEHSNHESEEKKIGKMRIQQCIQAVVAESNSDFSDLYKEIERRCPDVQQFYTKVACRLYINRLRKANGMNNSFEQPSQDGYLRTEILESQRRAFLFAHQNMINALNDSRYIYVTNVEVLPVVFITLESREAELYNKSLEKLKEWVPALSEKLSTIIVNYERNLSEALSQQFPRAERLTCNFYFYEAIMMAWMGCGLEHCSREALWKCCILPNIPASAWDQVFQAINQDLILLRQNTESAIEFENYLIREWQEKGQIVVTERASVRINLMTQNFAIFLHKKFRATYVNAGSFTESLKRVIKKTLSQFGALHGRDHCVMKGLPGMEMEKKRQRRIYDLYQSLGRLDLDEFLLFVMDRQHKEHLLKIHSGWSHHNNEWQVQVVNVGDINVITEEHEMNQATKQQRQFYGPQLTSSEEESEYVPPQRSSVKRRRSSTYRRQSS